MPIVVLILMSVGDGAFLAPGLCEIGDMAGKAAEEACNAAFPQFFRAGYLNERALRSRERRHKRQHRRRIPPPNWTASVIG